MRSWKLAWGCMGRPWWSWGHWTPKFWQVFFAVEAASPPVLTLLWWGSCDCLLCGSCLARYYWLFWGPHSDPLFLWTCITRLKLLQVPKSEGQSETNEEVFALHACSVVSWPFVTPWTVPCQGPLLMGFPRQEYWSGLPFPFPGDFPEPGIKPVSLRWQASSLPLSHLGNLWGGLLHCKRTTCFSNLHKSSGNMCGNGS